MLVPLLTLVLQHILLGALGAGMHVEWFNVTAHEMVTNFDGILVMTLRFVLLCLDNDPILAQGLIVIVTTIALMFAVNGGAPFDAVMMHLVTAAVISLMITFVHVPRALAARNIVIILTLTALIGLQIFARLVVLAKLALLYDSNLALLQRPPRQSRLVPRRHRSTLRLRL